MKKGVPFTENIVYLSEMLELNGSNITVLFFPHLIEIQYECLDELNKEKGWNLQHIL